MHAKRRQRLCSALLPAVIVAGAVIAGCESTPRGTAGGRIDPYRTTNADRGSRAAHIPTLLEFSDQAAQRLTQDLVALPEIQQAEQRKVLELGTVSNQTRTPTSDFEQIQRRLRSILLQSPVIRREFRVVEARSRMDREAERVQAAGAESGTAQYDIADTYILAGDFSESIRGGGDSSRSQYYFEFQLVNAATREIVWIDTYDLGQLRQ